MSNKSVRIFNINYSEKDREIIHSYISEVLDEAFLTNHTFCRKLEKEFNKIYTTYNSFCCTSATAGLEAVFRYINVDSKAVIVQSNTFIATAHAIQAAGGVIVPFDLNDEYVASLGDIKDTIVKCKEENLEIGAVCIVNISGRASSELFEIQNLCKEEGIFLVEDNAQGMLSTLDNKLLGTFSDFSVDSLQTTKVVACGEGGVIHIKDSMNQDSFRNHLFFGKDSDNNLLFSNIAGNYKLSELNAALALADFERSETRIGRRREIDRYYSNNVRSKKFRYLASPKGNLSSNYKSIFIANSEEVRESIEKDFKSNNISMTGYVYKVPLHKQPRVFKSSRYIERQLPKTDEFCSRHFTPPNYPEVTDDQVQYIIDTLNKFNC